MTGSVFMVARLFAAAGRKKRARDAMTPGRDFRACHPRHVGRYHRGGRRPVSAGRVVVSGALRMALMKSVKSSPCDPIRSFT